jgi:hypothetical protein
MKRLKLAMAMTLLVSAGLLGGCATTSGDDGKIILGKLAVTEQQRQNAAAKLKPKSGEDFSVKGSINIAKQTPVHVEFSGSPKMSAALNKRLSQAGYNITESGKPLLIAGIYQARGQFENKGFVNTGRLNIAELVEKSLLDTAETQRNAPKAGYGGTDIATANSMANLSGGVVSGLVNYMAVDALMTSLGVKDAINNGVGKAIGTDNDPYKLCAFGCEADKAVWNQPTQTSTYLIGFNGEKLEATYTSYDATFDAGGVVSKGLDKAIKF